MTFPSWSERLDPCLLVLFAIPLMTSCMSVPGRGLYRNAEELFDAGLERYILGDPGGAIAPLEEAAMLVPSGEFRSDIEYQLGRCYFEIGNHAAATEHFSHALEFTGGDQRLYRVWKGLGDARYFSGDFRRAAAAFEECLARETDPAILDEVYYKLAVACLENGDETAAQAYLASVQGYVPAPGEPIFERVLRSARALPEPRPDRTIPSPPTGWEVLTRRDWGAEPIRSNHAPMTRIRRITIHHSALYTDTRDRGSVADQIHRIQEYHMGSASSGGRDWADIGYHFIVDRAGRVWEGRPLRYQGAHAGNNMLNRGNVGIVLLGNFNEQAVNREQAHSLRMLVVFLMEKFGIPRVGIHTHSEMKSTECPGRGLQRVVEALRRDLRAGYASRATRALRDEIKHYVRRGETLFNIAKRYGVSVSGLREANGPIQGDRIRTGQKIVIPNQ